MSSHAFLVGVNTRLYSGDDLTSSSEGTTIFFLSIETVLTNLLLSEDVCSPCTLLEFRFPKFSAGLEVYFLPRLPLSPIVEAGFEVAYLACSAYD